MQIHYFQRYHSKENVDTSNTMLMLSRLYNYNADKFFAMLNALILEQDETPEITFDLQVVGDESVPDAIISQKSFKIVVETKLHNQFQQSQLEKHLTQFGTEEIKVLLTLDPKPMKESLMDSFGTVLKKYNTDRINEIKTPIRHVNITFEQLVAAMEDIVDERDSEIMAVLDDYKKYCFDEKLIPDDGKWMRAIKVTGKGKIAVKPDMIRLYVNKEELCKEYEDTLRRSAEDTELLKDLFEKLGFQRRDLKTVYFNVDTEYESYQDRYKSWKRRFEGYKYKHHMKIEFAADNKKLGQVLYALAHSSLKPEFSIEYTVADVEKCKNELLHKAIEDSIQKAQVLTTAANVKLGEIQTIDYSWGEIDFVTKPLNEMKLMECTECEMSTLGTYDIDIEADDIDVTDTVTVVWTIF